MTSQGELQNPEERDRGRLQKMERSPVLMDWYNQHSKNGYTYQKQSTYLMQFPSKSQ
jgi:hypothetical protein